MTRRIAFPLALFLFIFLINKTVLHASIEERVAEIEEKMKAKQVFTVTIGKSKADRQKLHYIAN